MNNDIYVITAPIITEKTLALANGKNVYTFRVVEDAEKIQVSRAVEELYNVEVVGVNIVKQKGESKFSTRFRKKIRKKGYKKAYVKLKSGSKIDVFETGES